jgi:hypothetical protein
MPISMCACGHEQFYHSYAVNHPCAVVDCCCLGFEEKKNDE